MKHSSSEIKKRGHSSRHSRWVMRLKFREIAEKRRRSQTSLCWDELIMSNRALVRDQGIEPEIGSGEIKDLDLVL